MIKYQNFNTFLLRTPFFAFENVNCYDRFRNDPIFKEMLLVASPDLHSDLYEKALSINEKTLFPSYRYFQRACTRPTPFGLFAGCSIGTIGDRSDIQLSEQTKYKRVTRLDMNYICALTQHIEKDRRIREKLKYYPNSSNYLAGDYLRYVEYYYRKTRRVHRISQVDNSEYLQRVLTLALGGAYFIELAASLVDDEITMEDASGFIHELIDVQILTSELEPSITNVQPLTSLIIKLNGLSDIGKQFTRVLSEIDAQLSEIDSHPIGDTGDIYPVIIKNIEKTKINTEIKYLFQTDLFKPVQQATINRKIIKDIQNALIFLNKINLPASSQSNLSKFKENFIKRYEDREMPMLFVLDTELGIGYADNNSGDISPIIDDLVIPRVSKSSDKVSITSIQSILLQKYQQLSQKIIELTDDDVKGIEAVWDDLTQTFSVMCQIIQDNEQGRTVYIQSVGGFSASSILGRFCHLDEQILDHTLAITAKEAIMNNDVIFAEITHLPESRTGNILLRPILRPHEISYLSKPSVSEKFVLSANDLYISVNNNRIILRSMRLDKEIIPRMSAAHNYIGQNPMPVYHFLCDLQHQNGRVKLGFSWNEVAQQMDYLPRVIYKNCILSKARWVIRKKELKTLVGIKEDVELLKKIREWQVRRNIPDTVLLVDGDNKLFINMKNPLSIRAFLSVVKNRPFFQIEEFLFDPATAIVRGSEGVFTNEFIFAFYKD